MSLEMFYSDYHNFVWECKKYDDTAPCWLEFALLLTKLSTTAVSSTTCTLVPPNPKLFMATKPPSHGVLSVTTFSLPSSKAGMLVFGFLKCRLAGITFSSLATITLASEHSPRKTYTMDLQCNALYPNNLCMYHVKMWLTYRMPECAVLLYNM